MAQQSKPLVMTTTQVLPFDGLAPSDFERLCLWLVEREGFESVEHLGVAGGEQGRDIVAWRDKDLWVFNCKRVRRFGPKEARVEIDKVLEPEPYLPTGPVWLVFIITCDVSARTRKEIYAYAEGRELRCEVWARTELDARVKRHPDIVREFFGGAFADAVQTEDVGAGPGQVFPGQGDDDDDDAVESEGEVKGRSEGDVKDDSDIPAARQAPAERVVRVSVDDSAITASAASDQPIRTKDEDKLGFRVYVEALAAFIASEDTTTPLVIGIDAPWGHGKTSLMHMVRSELNPKRAWYLRLWLWLKLQGWRIRWLATSPVWYSGKFALWVAKLLGRDSQPAFTKLDQWMKPPKLGVKRSDSDQKPAASKAPVTKRLFEWCSKVHQPLEARHPTIWFNAWKFDDEEAIWSALAVTILDQIKTNTSWIGRLFFWLRLWVRRFKHLRAWKAVAKKILWPALLGGAGWLWAQYSGQIDFLPPSGQDLVQWILWGGTILTAGLQMAAIVQDPFSLSFGSFVKAPTYREKIGFIGDFEEDFEHIVAIATSKVWGWKQRKLIIFIDDLDRCEPPKPADVIEAINVFLDSTGCVFVIGMDSRAVVASVEAKYEKLFQRTQIELPDQPTLGRCFLQKIVQVPFAIPPVPDHYISALVKHIIGPRPEIQPGPDIPEPEDGDTVQVSPPSQPGPTDSPAGRETRGDVGSPRENVHVWDAISKGVKYLEANPRQLKRFVNLFRLQLYIAHARGLFRELIAEDEPHSGYTLDSLAAWIALSMRWPRVISCLRQEYQKTELRQRLLWIAQLVHKNGTWIGVLNTVQKVDELRLDLDLAKLLGPKSEIESDTLKRVLLEEFSSQDADKSGKEKEGKKEAPAPQVLHWRAFPWEQWLGNQDFLQVVKALEEWWVESADHQRDWLTIAMLCDEPNLASQVSTTRSTQIPEETQATRTEAAA